MKWRKTIAYVRNNYTDVIDLVLVDGTETTFSRYKRQTKSMGPKTVIRQTMATRIDFQSVYTTMMIGTHHFQI